MSDQLWYFSFVKDGFNGACIVAGNDFDDALRNTHLLGCNPGGEVKAMQVDPDRVPEDAKNRLLSRDDLRRIFGAVIRM